MKVILGVIIVVIVCLVAFNYFTTGEFRLLPSAEASPAEVKLQELATRFDALEREFYQAGRGSAFSGVDSTSQVASIFSEMDEIESEVRRISEDGISMEIRGKARKVLETIREFKMDSR